MQNRENESSQPVEMTELKSKNQELLYANKEIKRLKKLNKNLLIKIEQESIKRAKIENEKKIVDRIIIEQTKKVIMGQMIGNIAHQWKQPLNAIGSIQTSIQANLLLKGDIPKEKLLKSVKTSFEIIKYLSDTLDTFYQLLNTNEYGHSFDVIKIFDAIRKITEYTFANCNIALIYIFKLESGHSLKGDGNEFLQALMNIILNAKEALDNTKVDLPTITVNLYEDSKNCIITIADNGGGIKVNPIESIFDMSISTKERGSGLGLFMAKNIIEDRFGGSIKATNKNDGALFTVEISLAKDSDIF